MNFLDELNPSQREAVTYNDGPHLVIAGAGSGKTRVLTYKIAYLLQQGMPAHNILALTFTNKAAREMKERICRLVGAEAARYLWMGTFHSICARILRTEADKLGFTRDFSIYDTTDSKSVVKAIVKELKLDDKIYKPAAVLSRISMAKNFLMDPQAYAANKDLSQSDRFARMYEMPDVYRLYQARLRTANAMDFDDLLVNMYMLLQTNEEVRRSYQSIFRYVLVDEYQDTNYVQYLLVQRLAEPDNRICVVGDDAQSIYSFRGADIRNILGFQQAYPEAKMFKLERNYRSTQTIVKAANALIHHNENQIYKEVYSENEVGDRLQLRAFATDRAEAEGIARLIGEEHRLRKVGYNDIAVLYRTNAQSRVFENELRRLGIPYRIYGSISFYQRKEIKDVISYFRLAANPKDNEALMRVINFPARSIGDTTLRKVSECAITQQVSMMDVVAHPVEYGLPVNGPTAKRLMLFAELMTHLQQEMDVKDAYEFAELVMRETSIMSEAVMDKSPEGIERKENLDELLSGIHEFVDRRLQEGISFTPMSDFLAEVSLLTDQDPHTPDQTERVTLMTVHAAKGLEFPVVCVVGLEENLFPSQHCTRPSEIEEERRLLYVAITRAMQRCHISYAKMRFKNGTVEASRPSPFLSNMDRQYIQQLQTESEAMPWSSRISSPGGYMSPAAGPMGTPRQAATSASATSTHLRSLDSVRAAAPAANATFAAGDRVQHKVFGSGTVQRVFVDNDNEKIEILFDGPGLKTLLLAFAKLTPQKMGV